MDKIKIYTTTTCPYCKMEKEFLDSKGIKYENILVDEDHQAAEEVIKMSGQVGVPFTVIDKEEGGRETILGFDKERLISVLGIR
ncbi:MAG: glutaredoxin family protein [bacterium]|nr:glutaredoxin family protein [bacterium]